MKISIITATYNSSKTLKDTIESVLNQTYKDIEYIIIDGLSTDDTVRIATQYQDSFNGRMKIISEKDEGIYDALNKGIRYSSGEVIGFVHADDILADNGVVEKINNTFVQNKCQLIYGDILIVNQDNNKIIRNWKSQIFEPRLLKHGWMLPHPTMYASRQMYEQVGEYNLRYHIGADYDLIIRALKQTPLDQICYIPQYIVRMRAGGTSGQSKNFKAMMIEDWHIIKENEIGNIWTLFMKKFSKLTQFLSK